MRTQEYIEQALKFTGRKSATVAGAPPFGETVNLTKVPRAPSECVIDLYRVSDTVAARSGDCSKELQIDPQAKMVAARQLHSVRRADRLEDSLYWLFSGVTLVYLLTEIIGR
jgi:hypothetical protein